LTLDLPPKGSNCGLPGLQLCDLCDRGVLCDREFGHDEHKDDKKDTTFIAHKSSTQKFEFLLSRLQL